MGNNNTVDVPANDYNSLIRGYKFIRDNSKHYPRDLVNQISLLASFSLPKDVQGITKESWGGTKTRWVKMSRSQYNNVQKLRALIQNIKREELVNWSPPVTPSFNSVPKAPLEPGEGEM